jgi:hypothetical protein
MIYFSLKKSAVRLASLSHPNPSSCMEHPTASISPRRGRPRKFGGPSRPITLTLPVATIEALAAVDGDLSRAIVRIVQAGARQRHAAAELSTFGRRAVIVVNASKALERRIGIDLVPLPDGRALISFEDATTPDAVELRIEDALEDTELAPADRAEFAAILEILKSARRSGDVTVLRRNIIVLEGRRRPRTARAVRAAKKTPANPMSRRSTK